MGVCFFQARMRWQVEGGEKGLSSRALKGTAPQEVLLLERCSCNTPDGAFISVKAWTSSVAALGD